MDFLTPGDQAAKERLEQLLKGKTHTVEGNSYYMNASLAEMISNKMDDEGFDIDWGTVSN